MASPFTPFLVHHVTAYGSTDQNYVNGNKTGHVRNPPSLIKYADNESKLVQPNQDGCYKTQTRVTPHKRAETRYQENVQNSKILPTKVPTTHPTVVAVGLTPPPVKQIKRTQKNNK